MTSIQNPISAFPGKFGTVIDFQSHIASAASRQKASIPVNNHRSVWIQNLLDRFNDITSLPLGWDGYSGKPVSFTNAVFAANILEATCIPEVSAPSLVPGSDGTLQIEWHEGGYDIEIDVLGPQKVVAYRYVHETGIEEVLEVRNDFAIVSGWVSDLYAAQSTDQSLIA